MCPKIKIRISAIHYLLLMYKVKHIFGSGLTEEIHDLYSLSSTIRVIKLRRMRWAMHVACSGERRGAYRVLAEKPEGKRPLGIPRRRWEDI